VRFRPYILPVPVGRSLTGRPVPGSAAWDRLHGELLVRVAGQVGLDTTEAQRILDSGEFADEVRETELFFQRAGIRSVPAIIINQRHLISGGQPPEVFERALREIAAQGDAPL